MARLLGLSTVFFLAQGTFAKNFTFLGNKAAKAACALGWPSGDLVCLSKRSFTICQDDPATTKEWHTGDTYICYQASGNTKDWLYGFANGSAVNKVAVDSDGYLKLFIGPLFDTNGKFATHIPTWADVANQTNPMVPYNGSFIGFDEGLSMKMPVKSNATTSEAPMTGSAAISSASASAEGAARASLASLEAAQTNVDPAAVKPFTFDGGSQMTSVTKTLARRAAPTW